MQLPGGQRREIIEDLLDLQIFTTMNSLLKDKVLINTEHLSQINSTKKLIEEKIKLTKQHLLEIQNNNDQIISEKKLRIEETDKQISDFTDQYHDIDNKIEILKENIEDEPKISKRINQLSQLKHKIEAKRAVLDKDINFLLDHEGCPTCNQVIDSEFKSKTIVEKSAEVGNIDVALEDLIKQYDETNTRLNEIMEVHMDLNSHKLDCHKIKTKISSLIDYRNNLEEEIKKINQKSDSKEDNKIVDFENELETIKKQFNELTEDKQILSAAASLLKDGGIKARIIKQYVPVINKLINKYLSSMDFFVQFELDEEFNETIKSRFRDEFSYASFSEGEKMRINLAILFTWRAVAKLRNSVSTNLLIMDEVFDSSLDSNGTEEFLKIINNLTSDTNTFIISHKTDQLYDKFSKVLKFEKHKNFSRVV
jgi:DNA repair exonuclease SbcCD ATPase subunit